MPRDMVEVEQQESDHVRVLRRAIKIWSDPKKRIRFKFHENNSYCALGVLDEAKYELGIKRSFFFWNELLGFKYDIANVNDIIGCWYVYRRMKKVLRKWENEALD